ncbi:tetratricopeptide repeat protein [Alteromonas sp. KUL49]|uniref:tetratricopeptide repeat protein n=1 Tax=Alteromonas sp. KUL49 TaxID=2480798 RepID=UPI00102F1858|nr:tetratricopeptide repeat protein [Alteromonas sp. KUL49]TAP34501.1 tetratricopeptide repeat protein [Alteromonas sp. KUL49]
MKKLFAAFLLLVAFTATSASESSQCSSCHSDIVSQWSSSDHGKAMDIATKDTVLGNFNNAQVSHHSQKATFFTRDNQFFISFTEGDNTREHMVSYVFGHYPLQEYLIKTDSGRMQVFPFAWDSRPNNEGGQRWYPIYPDEDITSNDRLHWLQPMQNWNGMCADCHSSGLTRNYDASTDSFDTQWNEINVSCQSCHGEMPDHGSKTPTESYNHLDSAMSKAMGQWLLKDGEDIASWHGEPRDNTFMDNCFACHSLRSPLTDGISPNTPFLDQFSPSLLAPPLYHPDGQIKEEVYVYGSFLQSKMYEAGVNCLDCHDPHTMKVKTQTNALCLQCHKAEVFDTPKHTFHTDNSAGAQCVNCHMPETIYMGVDARRDHSFSIPNPSISMQTGAPNACTNCHEDQTNEWADSHVTQWHGESHSLSLMERRYIAFMHGESISQTHAFQLIYSKELPVIKRATVIASLPRVVPALTDGQIRRWVNSQEPLIRLATAQIGMLLAPQERVKSYKTLLNDEFRAIRVAAANQLVGLGLRDTSFNDAFNDLLKSNDVSRWRGEGNLNQSLLSYQSGDVSGAIKLLQHGIEVDPFFAANYINLADLLRAQGDFQAEAELFASAVQALPNDGVMQYSYGMHLIRNNKKQQAIHAFERAVELNPEESQYWYIYALALDNVGKTADAVKVLLSSLDVGVSQQNVELGLNFAQKAGDRQAFSRFSQHR